MFYLLNHPLSRIIEMLLAGIVLLIVFRILNRFVASLVEEKRQVVFLQWTRFQIAVWIIFSLFLYSMLFRYNMYVTLIATAAFLGLGWNFWKDVFAGVLIKLENQFSIGNFVSTECSKGVLQQINFSQSALVNDAGELVVIPNSRLRNEVLTHHQNVSDASIYSVEVISSGGLSVSKLYEFAYNCPYISANKEITIEKQRDNIFNIRASIIDFSFADQADAYFKRLSKNG